MEKDTVPEKYWRTTSESDAVTFASLRACLLIFEEVLGDFRVTPQEIQTTIRGVTFSSLLLMKDDPNIFFSLRN